MQSINELQLHNRNVIEEISERNKTENQGNHSLPGVKILGAMISVMNRKNIQDDPKAQAKEADKIRSYYKRKGIL